MWIRNNLFPSVTGGSQKSRRKGKCTGYSCQVAKKHVFINIGEVKRDNTPPYHVSGRGEIMCPKRRLLSCVVCFFTIVLFICICLCEDPAISHANDIPGVTDNSVKIGLMGDLTGPAADAWIPLADALKLFFRMVNDGGGIHGRKINSIFEDDRYSIPLALACFKKLVFRDKIFVLQAASGVGHTAALIPLVEKEKIPLLAATGEKRFFVPVRKYLYSGIPWYADQAKLVFEYIFNDLKLTHPCIALMYPDTASGKDTREAVRELVKKHPVKEYKEIAFSFSNLDFTSQVMSLKRFEPDVVFIHGVVIDTASILRAAYRLGFHVPVIVNQYGCSEEVLAIAGKAARELIAVNCFGTWDDESPGVNKLRKISLQYSPKVRRRSPYFFQGWIAGILFYEGIKNAGRDLTRENYLKALESMRNFDTQGICGSVTFSPNDHKAIDNHRFYKADTDKKIFVPISGWRRPLEQ